MKPDYTKIIKRTDGTQYQISVRISSPKYGVIEYEHHVFTRGKGGKIWHNLPNTLHDYEIRQMSSEQKNTHRKTNDLRFVSQQEINLAITEFWESLKPKAITERCFCEGCSSCSDFYHEEKKVIIRKF